MDAYDYDAQEWVKGETGARFVLRQATERLALLESADGAAFALFEGGSRNTLIHNASAAQQNAIDYLAANGINA